MAKIVIASLWVRPDRTWEKVNLKRLYPEGTIFFIRWIPEGQTNYKQKRLESPTVRDAEIQRAKFVPPVDTNQNEPAASSGTREPGAETGQNSGCLWLLTTSHFVKYYWGVQIVTRKHLEKAAEKYRDATDELKKWRRTVKAARWCNIEEVRSLFKDADPVDGYVVFNIRQNRYRLITVIHFVKAIAGKQTKGHVYIRSFLTHKQHNNPDNWDKEYGTGKKK